MTDRDLAIAPTAAALICAVHDEDADEIARLLAEPGLDWPALCVVLAAHVSDETRFGDDPPMSTRHQVRTTLRLAAEAFDTTPEAILSDSRHRNTLDARAVAMAALRWSGYSSSWIGRQLDRDHSTVLHAVTRVGENPKLRAVAQRIAHRIGAHLFIEDGAA